MIIPFCRVIEFMQFVLKQQHFLTKIHFLVVVVLIENIQADFFELRSAHRVNIVSFLPIQSGQGLTIFLVIPVGTGTLDLVYAVCNCDMFGQKCQDMNMICNPVY